MQTVGGGRHIFIEHIESYDVQVELLSVITVALHIEEHSRALLRIQ